jgi:hypothetical protein
MKKVWTLVSSRKGRAIAAVAVVLFAGVAAVNLDQRSERARAGAWANSHKSSLPKSLAQLAAYPEDYRKAIFHAMPATDKSRMWREQLQTVLERETLNNEQRTFIEKTMALATPASFEPNQPTPEVCPDIARLFSDPDLRDKVTKLGAVTPPSRGVWSTVATVSQTVHRAVGLNARGFKCDCRGLGLCECGLTESCMSAGGCEQTEDCGCIWSGTCDKYCEAQVQINLRVGGSTTVK